MNLVADGEIDTELAFYSGFFNLGSLFDFMPRDSMVIALRPRMIQTLRTVSTDVWKRSDVSKNAVAKFQSTSRHPHIRWPEVALGIEALGRRLEIDPFGIDTSDLGTEASATHQTPFAFQPDQPRFRVRRQ